MANQASAASSSSSAPSGSDSTGYPYYDVFINHRGPDVKNTFAAHLYRRLLDHGLQVFLDKPELLQGHPITPQIQAAIQVASVHIAIFSPTYADSKWCLEELVLMLESKGTILPVFYKVQPSQLRWSGGAYAKSLWQLEQKKSVDAQTGEERPRYDFNTIQNWRVALSKAADISGFELQDDEDELLKRVVQGVLKNVSKPPLYVAKHPTGVEDKLQDFEVRVLQEDQQRVSARVVGIVGFGGVGKTTLAKAFFNSKRSYYTESSFVFDVRETSARNSLGYLQSKLIEDLKHINIKIESPDEGIGILARYLSSCQALIVLDDVDSAKQLEVLLPIKDILSPQSLILITSRDKHVLKSSGVLETSIYNLKGLNTHHSKELFCSYAFYQPLPPLEFEGLVDRFVKACDGLPLSLKVIGALVCGEDDKVYWEEQLDRLHQTLPSEIQERLRLSYDSLNEKDQDTFLDIACFFLGEERDWAIRICGLVGLRNLEDKCLLEVDSESKIRMHDHIRDCARNIAVEGFRPRRLCQPTTNIMNDLLEQTPSGITQVRGITTIGVSEDIFLLKNWEWLNAGQCRLTTQANNISKGAHPFNNSHFRGIRNLRFVAVGGSDLESILRKAQSPHLVWLRWIKCSDSSLPAWIPIENLRVLEVAGSRLNILWPHQSHGPLQLRELNIFAPLSELPKSIGQLKHLERIAITNGDSLPATVETLPQEFCDLRSLKFLALKWFSKLMSLPDSFGKLTNLQHIDLEGASSLQVLPNSFGDLSQLEGLYLNGARAMISLPDSFGKLTNLRHIELRGASSLMMLPNSFGDLRRLERLYINDATAMLSLPDSFGKLINLQHLDLGIQFASSLSLQMLPNSFGDLRRLEYLYLRGARAMKSLPESFGKLTNLQHIDLGRACSLQILPNSFGDLSRLEHIYLKGAEALISLPDSFGKLTNLRHMDLGGASSLQMLPNSFGDLSRLEQLCLNGATTMRSLPDSLGKLTNLQHIDLGGASSLQMLPNSFGDLSRLEHLSLNGATVMMSLPDSFGKLTNLQYIDLGGASSLQMLPNSFGDLSQLEHLCLKGATAMMSLPDSVGKLTNLQYIDLGGASCLQMLPNSFGDLSRLKHLSLAQCSNLTFSSGAFRNTTMLEYLELRHCSNVKELTPQIAHQRSMKYLYIESTDFKEFQCFIRDLCNLEVLHIRLPPSVRQPESVEELPVPQSPKLKCLPDSFGPFTHLTELVLEGCGIEYLPEGLLNLNNLKLLQVVGCPLRELRFRTDGEAEGGRAWNDLDSASDKCMPSLWRLVLKDTKISEVAFPKGVCPNLIFLQMEDCQELSRIRGLCGLSKLEGLHIKSCVELEDIGSLENLKSLQQVRLEECVKLKSIQGLAQLTNLMHLVVAGCREIVELPGVENCILYELNVSGCPKLKNITELGQLSATLRFLWVNGCHEMVGLPGVEQCMLLWTLDARDCPKLQWGKGVLQQLRIRLKKSLFVDVKQYKRRKLRGH